MVPTHLDSDHAGGLADFPHATVHVHDVELAAAMAPRTRNERSRYPAHQWAHGPQWKEHRMGGESWFGFDGVRTVSEDVVLIPLMGHTRGHVGVAVRRSSVRTIRAC
ncbi:MAG TPA: hypothetical protein VGO93_02075 [Candidatus Xenobia bacterium]